MYRLIRYLVTPKILITTDQLQISLMSFLISILLYRILGLEQFGMYSIFFVVMVTLQSINHSAVVQLMMSLIPAQPSRRGRSIIAGRLLVYQIGIAFPFSVLGAYVFDVILGREYGISPLSTFASYFLLQFGDFFRRFLLVSHKFGMTFLIGVVRHSGLFLVILILSNTAGFRIDIQVVIWLTILVQIASILVSISSSARDISFKAEGYFEWIGGILPASAWLGMGGALQILSHNTFVLLAGVMLSPAAVGLLRVAQTISSPMTILHQIFETYVPQRAAEHRRIGGDRELLRYLRVTFKLGFSLAGCLAILTFIFSDQLAVFFFSDDLGDVGLLVCLLLAVGMTEIVLSFVRFYLRTILITKPIFVVSVISALVALSVAYPLLVAGGVVGVVIGILICRVISLILLWYFARVSLISNRNAV